MEPVAVTIPEACRALSLSRSSVYELIAAGNLEAVKIAGRRLVKVESIKRLVAEAA